MVCQKSSSVSQMRQSNYIVFVLCAGNIEAFRVLLWDNTHHCFALHRQDQGMPPVWNMACVNHASINPLPFLDRLSKEVFGDLCKVFFRTTAIIRVRQILEKWIEPKRL